MARSASADGIVALLALVANVVGACDPAPSQPDAAPSPSASASISASAASRQIRPPKPAPAPTDAADGGALARALPRIQFRGGRFLKNPRVVTITFSKDDPKLVARLEQLGSVITRSPWWHTVTEGYCNDGECIGEGSAGVAVRLEDPLPAELKDDELEAILVRSQARFGTLDANTLLVVYLPPGVGFRDRDTKFCDSGPRGLHRTIDLTKDKRIAFAVVPRCATEAELTGTASHEILEATTNPFPAERGFAFLGGTPMSGFGFAGLEPVDPCGLVNMGAHWTVESGFVVQRAWSNREAIRGHDPCVPARPGVPYAMLVPREAGVRLGKEGETATLELDASTGDADLGTWAVSAFDVTGHGDKTSYADVSLDKSTVKSGDVVMLTVTLKKRAPGSRSIIGLVSTIGVHSHMWPLLLVSR